MAVRGRRRGRGAWAMAVGVLAVAACGAGQTTPPGSAPPESAPPVVGLDQLSFRPVLATADAGLPEAPPQTPPPAPPVGPPEGVPPPPPELTLDYAGPPDDLGGFVAAYRAAFGLTEGPDEAVESAGSRLCAYLQRQATPNGSVDLERAVTEADINEPGYPREVWQQAFEIATAHFCGEFSFAPGTEG